jgi:hypothetical protein
MTNRFTLILLLFICRYSRLDNILSKIVKYLKAVSITLVDCGIICVMLKCDKIKHIYR